MHASTRAEVGDGRPLAGVPRGSLPFQPERTNCGPFGDLYFSCLERPRERDGRSRGRLHTEFQWPSWIEPCLLDPDRNAGDGLEGDGEAILRWFVFEPCRPACPSGQIRERLGSGRFVVSDTGVGVPDAPRFENDDLDFLEVRAAPLDIPFAGQHDASSGETVVYSEQGKFYATVAVRGERNEAVMDIALLQSDGSTAWADTIRVDR